MVARIGIIDPKRGGYKMKNSIDTGKTNEKVGKVLTTIGYTGGTFFLILFIFSVFDRVIAPPETEPARSIIFLIFLVIFAILVLIGNHLTKGANRL